MNVTDSSYIARVTDSCRAVWNSWEGKGSLVASLVATAIAVSLLVPGILALTGQMQMVPYSYWEMGMTYPKAISLVVIGSIAAAVALVVIARTVQKCATECAARF